MKKILVANLKGGSGKTMTAINLVTALSHQGFNVGLADADAQQSSLQWLKRRPEQLSSILKVDWRQEKSIGSTPKKLDFLVIDAPGAVELEHAEVLIRESDMIIVPLQLSFFDVDSTKRFMKKIESIKRVRKGKVPVHIVANQLKPTQKNNDSIEPFETIIGQSFAAKISDRTLYSQLAEQGKSIFDFTSKRYLDCQEEWESLLKICIE